MYTCACKMDNDVVHFWFQLEAKETAKVFEDFVATFEDCDTARKTFVRGSVINPDEKGICM